MTKTFLLFIGLLIVGALSCYAQKGKDGTKPVTASGTIFNEYTSLTANASTGDAFIKVNNSTLNANHRFTTSLAKGDLLMIVQMQGATINGAPNDSSWGAITIYGNCGQYEFAEVSSAPDASTININCTLKNNYTASGKVQVVRVPRFSSLTISSGGVLTSDTWNGTTGGIVVIEVQNNTIINGGGSIDASGKGFRGGNANAQYGGSNYYVRNDFKSTDINVGGEKGESIAGYQSDYDADGGRYARGAPANGGGGGNAWNCAGGGGANAGNVNQWTGNGNPDISTPSWANAWNLEYNGFATSTSSGGGKGGYAVAGLVNGVSADPLVTGPNNAAWGNTFFRNNAGGKGGRPLDYSTGRIFLGGGGGAPHEDDGHVLNGGGPGGGIVYLLSYGTVEGSGNIISNGNPGSDANCGSGNGDPPGGGGGGGTIILNSTGAISSISITANGGKGGNQIINNVGEESEGGGGGGGGGYIAVSNGAPTRLASGGANGTTNSIPMQTFPPDGGTKGGDGLAKETINPISFSLLIVDAGKDVTICNGQSIALYGTGGDSTITTYSWAPVSSLVNASSTHPVASPTVTTTYTLTATSASCPGTDSVVVTVIPKVVINPLADTAFCTGQSAFLNPNGSAAYTYSWTPPIDLSCTNCSNPSANPSIATTYTVIASNQYCSDTAQSIVSISPSPTLLLNDTAICYGQLTTLYPVTNGTLVWSPVTNLTCTSCNNPQVTPLTNQTYTITATLGSCTVTDSFKVTADQTLVFAGPNASIFNGSSISLQASGGEKYIWSPDGTLSSDTAANPIVSPSVTTTYSVIGSDALGCTASAELVITVNDPCQLPAVPNAFSPNGNGSNDIFKMLNPYADKLLTFNIYNRWGQLVFQTTDLNRGWNGEFNGKPEPMGTYVYYIRIVCQGETISYKGNVTLLR